MISKETSLVRYVWANNYCMVFFLTFVTNHFSEWLVPVASGHESVWGLCHGIRIQTHQIISQKMEWNSFRFFFFRKKLQASENVAYFDSKFMLACQLVQDQIATLSDTVYKIVVTRHTEYCLVSSCNRENIFDIWPVRKISRKEERRQNDVCRTPNVELVSGWRVIK